MEGGDMFLPIFHFIAIIDLMFLSSVELTLPRSRTKKQQEISRARIKTIKY
jgi:hypothetical protein